MCKKTSDCSFSTIYFLLANTHEEVALLILLPHISAKLSPQSRTGGGQFCTLFYFIAQMTSLQNDVGEIKAALYLFMSDQPDPHSLGTWAL